VFAWRRRRLTQRLHESLPPFLEPGERTEVAAIALVDRNPNVLIVTVTVVVFAAWIGVDVAFGVGPSSGWSGLVVFTAVFAGTTSITFASRWVVLTDRRLLLLKLAYWSQRPVALVSSDLRSAARATARDETAWGWRSVDVRRSDGTMVRLRMPRLWHPEVTQIRLALSSGIPPAPPPSMPLPPPPAGPLLG
jgi:hypothetical protein